MSSAATKRRSSALREMPAYVRERHERSPLSLKKIINKLKKEEKEEAKLLL